MIRKWNITDETTQRRMIDEILARVQDIDDPETAGVIVAQDLIDIVVEHTAPRFYNQGVHDAKKIFTEKVDGIESDIDALVQL